MNGAGGDTTAVTTGATNAGYALLSEMRRLGAECGGRYIWGATGPNGYDCSGLVWKAMRNLGIYRGVRFTTVTFVPQTVGITSKTSSPVVGSVVLWAGHMGVVSGQDKFFSALSTKSGIKESSISGHEATHGPAAYFLVKDSDSAGTVGTHSFR